MRLVLEAYRSAYRGLPRPVWLIATVLLINRSGTMVLPFLVLFLTREKGYSPSLAGQLLAVYGIGSVAGSYLGGRMADRLGTLRVIAGSLLLSSPGFLMIPWCGSAWSLAAVLLYLSLVAESARPATITATTQFTPPALYPRALALNRLALNLGMSIGPAVGGFLAVTRFEAMFAVNATMAAVAGCAALRLLGRYRDHPSRRVAIQAPGVRGGGGSRLWGDKRYLRFIVLQFFTSLVFFQVTTTLPLYWRNEYGLNESQIGLLMATNTILIVMFEMVLTERMQRFRPLLVVAAGAVLTCLGFGLTPLGTGFLFAAFSVVVWTCGEMLAAPFSASYAASRAGDRDRGSYMGLFSMCFSAGSVCAPLLGTALYEVHPGLPWGGCLVLAGILGGGFLWMERSEASEAREEGERRMAGGQTKPAPSGSGHGRASAILP